MALKVKEGVMSLGMQIMKKAQKRILPESSQKEFSPVCQCLDFSPVRQHWTSDLQNRKTVISVVCY